jgi:hypothetical protein
VQYSREGLARARFSCQSPFMNYVVQWSIESLPCCGCSCKGLGDRIAPKRMRSVTVTWRRYWRDRHKCIILNLQTVRSGISPSLSCLSDIDRIRVQVVPKHYQCYQSQAQSERKGQRMITPSIQRLRTDFMCSRWAACSSSTCLTQRAPYRDKGDIREFRVHVVGDSPASFPC